MHAMWALVFLALLQAGMAVDIDGCIVQPNGTQVCEEHVEDGLSMLQLKPRDAADDRKAQGSSREAPKTALLGDGMDTEPKVIAVSKHNDAYYCNVLRVVKSGGGTVTVHFSVYGDGNIQDPLDSTLSSSSMSGGAHLFKVGSHHYNQESELHIQGELIYNDVPADASLSFRYGSWGTHAYSTASLPGDAIEAAGNGGYGVTDPWPTPTHPPLMDFPCGDAWTQNTACVCSQGKVKFTQLWEGSDWYQCREPCDKSEKLWSTDSTCACGPGKVKTTPEDKGKKYYYCHKVDYSQAR